jgi:NAD-dependent SIR2 family protein deacetylase
MERPMAAPEIAIFLGAGASCSEGAPTQGNLFRDFFGESFDGYQGIARGHPSLTAIKTMKNRLVRFFEVFFGFNPEESYATAHFPTFEEALGIVDLALIRDDGFRGFEGNLSSQQLGATLRNVRSDFVFLIALILDKKLEQSIGRHALLVRKLSQDGALNRCAFVSFNYDILIDNALGAQYEDYFLDYGIEYANFNGQEEFPRPRPHPVSLLKLHGSLNWLYCSTCSSVAITPRNKGVCNLVVSPADCRCGRCNSLTVPIIIPPTYFKVLSNVFLQEVWHRAEKTLSSCRTWVFCGYSFPDADMHVKYLLKRVQVNSPGQRKIMVVNWHEDKEPHAAAAEQQRYRRFFGDTAQLKYEKLSFEQFAADPNQMLNAVSSSSLE